MLILAGVLAELVWTELADHAPQPLHLIFSTPPETKSSTAVANICRCFHHPNQKNYSQSSVFPYRIQTSFHHKNLQFQLREGDLMEVLCWIWKTPDSPLATEEETSASRSWKGDAESPTVFCPVDLVGCIPAKKNGGKIGSLKFLESPWFKTKQVIIPHVIDIIMSMPPEVICPCVLQK